jgi:uncharacterized damage-inducible protein DinB
LLLRILDEAYEKQAWHGPNLKGSLRGLTAREAAWRPFSRRHSIWEVAVHAAYWKYAVRRRLTNEKRGSFPLKGSNWFPIKFSGARVTRKAERLWREHLALLEETHRSLRRAIAGLNSSLLRRKSRGSKHTVARLIYGIAAHDTYHAGQIQLLKRLQGA